MGTFTPELWRAAGAAAATAALPPWPASWQHIPTPANDASAGDADAQQLRIDLSPVEQILRKTRSVALGRHRCPLDHPQFALGGGPHRCAYIAFHRTSVKMRIGDARAEVTTPNNATFYNFGQSYSREAIGAEGDECDWLAVSPALLRAVPSALDRDVDDGRLFPRAFAPVGPATFFAQRRLFALASDPGAPLNSLQLEEAVTGLIGSVVNEACEFWGLSGKTHRRPRPLCHRRRLQIIEDAKALLAREYWTDLSLADLARRLHCSAAHLSRMFHAATGFKLCDFRQELRLRKGLFLLEESGLEIGDIAVQVGFASHSHFTSAFHRRFGMNPSDFLKWKSRAFVRSMAAYR
jgi:AraC-like DNA-binding protein